MQDYLNMNNNSGIVRYDVECIIVEFGNGSAYLYNSVKPGKIHVKEMKKLAKQGFDLNTYINRFIKDNYYKKLR